MESLCAKCARRGTDCCSGEGYGTTVTLEEAEIISRHTGKHASEFTEFSRDMELADGMPLAAFPNLIFVSHKEKRTLPLATKNGNRLMLKKVNIDGRPSCIFLGPKGCTIPEVRPKYCRFYPFWLFEDRQGEIQLFLNKCGSREDENCLIIQTYFDDEGHERQLNAVGETEKGLKELGKAYISELKQYSGDIEELEKGKSLSELRNN
ncbi:YkgJ family cysteine cluster protein [Candidatus Woesearchaeota archaeon]|nr:YkgJ family cysteine cluster protein [Candidatus Woesearchaeota archaeon]